MNKHNRDFYAPKGEIMLASHRTYLDNEFEFPHLLKLVRSWEKPEIYRSAMLWMMYNKESKVAESRGITYINNERYFDTIQFKSNEDRLIFAILFAEICDRGFYK